MNIQDILSPARTLYRGQANSKKSVLDIVSKLLTQDIKMLAHHDMLTKLNDRERLGSTGIGHGVAIPHARLDCIDETIATLVRLESPIDFGSADDKPVDLIFAFLVPDDSTDEHLSLISTLATLFNKKSFRQALRQADSNEDLYHMMVEQKELI